MVTVFCRQCYRHCLFFDRVIKMKNDYLYYRKCIEENPPESSAMYMLHKGIFMNGEEMMKDEFLAKKTDSDFAFRKEFENGDVLEYDVVRDFQQGSDYVTFIAELNADSKEHDRETVLVEMDKYSLMGRDIGHELYVVMQDDLEQERERVNTGLER